MKYVIFRKGLQYNDERYDVEENGEPLAVTDTKEKAEQKVIELSVAYARETNFFDYYLDYGNIDFKYIPKTFEKFIEIFIKEGFEVKLDEQEQFEFWYSDETKFPITFDRASEKEIMWFLKKVNRDVFYFSEVVEI